MQLPSIIHNVIEIFKEEGVVLYPTDTVWGIGCDATDKIAVEKVFKIKQRTESKSLIILVDSLEMLQKYVEEIPASIIEILEKIHKPTTIIYNNPKPACGRDRGLASNVIASDNTVAIRVVQDKFCKELIKQFGKPIVSTSANYSGKSTPKSFKEIELSILNTVDYVVNLHRNKISNTPSVILRIDCEGEIEVIRE